MDHNQYEIKLLKRVCIGVYSLLVALIIYFIFTVKPTIKNPTEELIVNLEYTQPTVQEPSKPSIEELCASAIKGEYVDSIAENVLANYNKYGLPIWFSYAVTCSESEDELGRVNILAYNKRCNARGGNQITPICLKEYNEWHSVKYTMDDMWDIQKNYEVAGWYLARIRDHYLKDWPNLTYEDIYIAYNVGPVSFKKYFQDYYNGYDVVRHCDYNALNRFKIYEQKYLGYFK